MNRELLSKRNLILPFLFIWKKKQSSFLIRSFPRRSKQLDLRIFFLLLCVLQSIICSKEIENRWIDRCQWVWSWATVSSVRLYV